MNVKAVLLLTVYIFSFLLLVPENAYAMHIMEGFLPVKWCGLWAIVMLPFFMLGMRSIQKTVAEKPSLKMLLALAGAFAFVLSSLKIPSVAGSSSHMTGVGLGAILFGPAAMSVLGLIVLVFQAMLLAHGGITTLGANAFSMAVAGPFAAYFIYRALREWRAPFWLCVFLGVAAGDLLTYIITSLQLALAFPAESGGVALSFAKFSGVFAFTQIPLAISEGLLTVMVFNMLIKHSRQELIDLSVLKEEVSL